MASGRLVGGLLVLSVTAALLVTAVRGGRRSLSDVETEINEFVEATMASKAIPGLSLAVVSGLEQLSRGYGVKNLNNTTDVVTADTLFYIASATKAFTATLLSQLLQDTNLTLNTPVKQILPSFQLVEYYRQQQTSLLDLLAHRVGIPESLYNWLLGAVTTREGVVLRGLYFKATEPFRDSQIYSNLFYIAAGLVTEALSSGQSWEDVMRQRLFTPLGMTGTSFMDQLTSQQLELLATPYEVDRTNNNTMKEVSLEFFKHAGVGGPSGSIVSSAKDLVQWLNMLTHNGLNEVGQRVVDDSVLVDTMSPHVVTYPITPTNDSLTSTVENYGLGWNTGFYNGYRMANHGGYLFGYQSLATVYPSLNLGIFTCINGQTSDGPDGQTTIHNFITDLLMPSDNSSTLTAKGRLAHPKVVNSVRHQDVDSLIKQLFSRSGRDATDRVVRETRRRSRHRRQSSLDEYTGTFGNFAYGNATIVLDPETGRLRVDYGDLMRADMFQLADGDRFVAKPYDPLWFFPTFEMTFARRSEDNVVVNVTVPILLASNPPVFTRGLMMSEAPPPPTCDC